MGLLDSVISALTNGRPSADGNQRGLGEGGGINAQLLQVVLGMLAGGGVAGGIGGLADKFRRGGLGDVVGSWIGRGQNMPISGEQLGGVLGPDILAQIAQQLGVSQGEAAGQLSQALPQVVDQLTPEGRVPDEGFGDVAEVLSRFR